MPMATSGGGGVLILAVVASLSFLVPGCVGSTLKVRSASEGSQAYPDPANIVVGLASDLTLQVICFSSETGTGPVTWSQNGMQVAQGLQAFGVSQDVGGILRVHPVAELQNGNQFLCSDGNRIELNVTFSLGESLFFTSPETSLFVSVPDIPEATQDVVREGDTNFYHTVRSDRGVYRSADLTVPVFRMEPASLTVTPNANGTGVAAFACSVSNFDGLELGRFLWNFRAPLIDIPVRLSTDVEGVTILGAETLADSGTSILILDSVTSMDEGMYYCEVEYPGNRIISSEEAELTFDVNGTTEGPRIILSPPQDLTFALGTNVTVPCVASDLSTPMFLLTMPTTQTAVTMGGLNIFNPSGDHVVFCTVGENSSRTTINVLDASTPAMIENNNVGVSGAELLVNEGDPVTLTCSPDDAIIVINNETSSSAMFQSDSIQRDDAGFYQCLSTDTVGDIDSLYLLVTYVDPPEISGSVGEIRVGEPMTGTIELSCSAQGNPLPLLKWSISPEADTQSMQLATSFPDPASSNISINISSLTTIGQYTVTCSAEVDGSGGTLVQSSTFNFSVGVVFEGISVTTSAVDGVLNATEIPGSPSLELTCTLDSGLEPTIVWLRNGEMVDSSLPLLTQERITYTSSLTINATLLTPPTEFFQCIASLNVSEGVLMQEANATITLEAILTDIVVSPAVQTLNLQRPLEQNNDMIITCTVLASLLPTVTWTQSGLPVEGSEPVRPDPTELRVESTLTVNATDLRGRVLFECTASLDVVNLSLTFNAAIIANIAPLFLTNPLNETIVPEGFNVTLRCSVEGYPAPSITWETLDGGVIPSDENDTVFVIESNTVDSLTSSSLSFMASADDFRTSNDATFRCVAANEANNRTESELGRLIVAEPPGRVAELTENDVTATSAVITWTRPFSLLPITGYSLLIVQFFTNSDEEFLTINETLEPNITSFSASTFLPFSRYGVAVAASNLAGEGPATSFIFWTNQSRAGPPENVTTSARRPQEILVTFSPTPINRQNGVVIGYRIYIWLDGAPQFQVDSGRNVFSVMISNLLPGRTYTLFVAAQNGAGEGERSPEVTQTTISVPPTPPSPPPPPEDREITQTTIPFTLPEIPNLDQYSHFWVIAMKLEGRTVPSQPFTDNSSFVLYPSQPDVNEPYVAAEISAENYPQARNFILGDADILKTGISDNQLYINGPLNQSTTYTLFVWGFSPVPESGQQRVKRQEGSTLRQYDSFSSSDFFEPVTTASRGLSVGAIVGIVIGVLVIILIFIAIIIVSVILYDRLRYSVELGPPPSRKGSMRLRDQNEIVRDNLRSSLRNSLRSSFRAITLRNVKAEAELQDLNPDDARLPVTVEEFPKYVRTMHKNTDHLFSEEYEILSIKSPTLAHVQCSLPNNIQKNRYANINCYDDSRIILSTNKETNTSDYINANYIDGYKEKCAYIATQGPLANTTHDFWRMVWEQDSCCIIMLTNLVEKSRVKCHQYWPEVGSINMGDLTIMLIEVQDLAYYTIRTFRLSKGNQHREVKQFHYTGWPDFGVPDYPHPVIAFIRRLSHFKRTTEGPDVIHCSAGVGRTGTLVAIQAMIFMMEEEGKLDIFNFVLGMRQQRNYMVQTERQYIFIHDTMLEYIRMGKTAVSMQNLRAHFKKLQAHDPKTESSLLEKEYGHLNEIQEVDESQYQPGVSSVNKPKNRFQTVLPYDRYRVRLLLHPGVHGSDYINASYVDGYEHRHQFIVTQGPMSNTVTDFWRMVWEHRCSCILMLCQCEERGKEQCVCYWPTEKVRQHGDMFIEQSNCSQLPSYTMREFAVTNTKINESRTIKHFQYSDWPEGQSPPNAADIIDLIGVVQKTQHSSGRGPIIVHDNSSVGRAGAFVVLSSILEQLKLEGVVDPFFTIHTLRQQQPGLVNSFDQYRFIYQAVLEFLDSFDHYSNFG